jgi:hypothetical protein
VSYTEVFGGSNLYPSDVSYLPLALSTDVTLQWPLEANAGALVAASIIDVTPTGAYSITMPDATLTAPGQPVLFNNFGPYVVTVLKSGGGVLCSLDAGEQWQVYLSDNSTAAGTWRAFRFGAATASAQAASLAGYGLVAVGNTLAQAQQVSLFNSSYTAGLSDRSKAFVWVGSSGLFNLPSASAVGNDYFLSVRNNGSGVLTVDGAGSDLINGASTCALQPNDSAILITDGTNWYTVGLGQDPVFAFDYTSISVSGSTYTLSGTELNRVAYKFVGTLSSNVTVRVPNTIQQYWVWNDTTGGSYTLSIGTLAQAAPLVVPRGSRGIYYSDGSNLVKADTASIALPINISDGGTGASTAASARINLGGSSVGIAVFTAATPQAAQAAIGIPVPPPFSLGVGVWNGVTPTQLDLTIPAGVAYSQSAGQQIIFKVPTASPSGSITLKVGTNAAAPLINVDGSAMNLQDLMPAASYLAIFDGTNFQLQTPTNSVLSGYAQATNGAISGYIVSNDVTNPNTTLNVSAGNCRDSTNSRNIPRTAGLIKNLFAVWAAGTNQGGRDVATAPAANETWHVHAILNGTSGVTDVLFSKSATAPTLPTGYTHFRRILSVILDSSANIKGFVQTGSYVQLKVRNAEFATTSNGVAAGTLRNMQVPLGLKLRLDVYYQSTTSGGSTTDPAFSGCYDPDVGVPNGTLATNNSARWAQIRVQWGGSNLDLRYQTTMLQVYTNTNAQIYTASNDTGDTIAGGVVGWLDPRDSFF